jgi:hypothetical protein
MENLEALKYPIGDFVPPKDTSSAVRSQWIEDIAHLPSQLRTAVVGLSDEQLETPYRPDGWTVRQVVHHIPDSHMNSYMRFRLALTEDNPTIRPYEEQLWAELPDAKSAAVDFSLDLLEMLHKRLPKDFCAPCFWQNLTIGYCVGYVLLAWQTSPCAYHRAEEEDGVVGFEPACNYLSAFFFK